LNHNKAPAFAVTEIGGVEQLELDFHPLLVTKFSPLLRYLVRKMVRLITHNLLACHVRGCTSNNFPLVFKDVQLELREAEFNPDFLRGFMPKLDWKALIDTAKSVVCL
jgi:hypothetical protein